MEQGEVDQEPLAKAHPLALRPPLLASSEMGSRSALACQLALLAKVARDPSHPSFALELSCASMTLAWHCQRARLAPRLRHRVLAKWVMATLWAQAFLWVMTEHARN
jgi:hypothetical protein